MEMEMVIDRLVSLVRLDIDAIHAYSQAIEKIDVTSIRDRLVEFQADHERHVDDLNELILSFDGMPPEFSRDFKGFVIQGMTALRTVTGTEEALKAMRSNEQLTNRKYDEALALDLPERVRSVIEVNREDERRHLEYIERTLELKTWEGLEKAA